MSWRKLEAGSTPGTADDFLPVWGPLRVRLQRDAGEAASAYDIEAIKHPRRMSQICALPHGAAAAEFVEC